MRRTQQEFEAYLKCGRLEEGFLRVRCERCHAEKLVAFSCKKRGFCPSCGVLGEVYRTISRHLIGKAGLSRATGATGAVTLVQRFGSALNLNAHFHMVFLDGALERRS